MAAAPHGNIIPGNLHQISRFLVRIEAEKRFTTTTDSRLSLQEKEGKNKKAALARGGQSGFLREKEMRFSYLVSNAFAVPQIQTTPKKHANLVIPTTYNANRIPPPGHKSSNFFTHRDHSFHHGNNLPHQWPIPEGLKNCIAAGTALHRQQNIVKPAQ
ncbi:hypothetical protein ACFL5J_02625 [Thermodesulfobacteriota bacterium]